MKDGTAKYDEFGYWARRGEHIIYHAEGSNRNRTIDPDRITCVPETDEDGNWRFYNKGESYKPEPQVIALRPRNTYDLVWREDGKEIVMRDAKDNEFARFESIEER